MSNAAKCDRCEALFEAQAGCITLDVSVAQTLEREQSPEDRHWANWTDVDFCAQCSKEILAVIAKALDGLKL